MGSPDIYRYLDFRAYLRDWFSARQVEDPRFSKRQFARLAGKSSPGLLTEVMEGDRELTPAMVEAFANALELTRSESDFFDALVQLGQATDSRTRNHAWERISAVRAFQEARPIEGQAFTYLSSWWFPVVRELASRPDFVPDPAWIARRVRPPITEAQARRALDTLTELGLLVRDAAGALRPADAVLVTPHEVSGLAVHNYHRGMLERALEAIDRFEPEDRHFVAATVSIPHALVPQLKRELDALQERILDLASRTDTPIDEVVQVHLVMFPLSDRAGEAKG